MRPLVLGAWLATAAPGVAAALAPTSVTLIGDLQSELGCASDVDPTCAATQLTLDASDGIWQKGFSVPAGTWKYKVAIDGALSETYGGPGGADITLTLASPATVKFYFDPVGHWVTSDKNASIATAAGSFQSELSCPGDWQPDCLKSWLQDPDGDGLYTFTTKALPEGTYEMKVALNEGWAESYGQDGGSSNLSFTVPAAGTEMIFTWNAVTKKPTVREAGAPVGDIVQARAQWVSPDTLAWSPENVPAGSTFRLHHQPDGAMRLTSSGIQGGASFTLTVDPAGLSAEQKVRFPLVKDALALKVPEAELARVPEYLKGQLAVSVTPPGGVLADATSVQTAGVLDALYAYTGPLGVAFETGVVGPTLRLWAPTARKVDLLVFDSSTAAQPSARVPMQAGARGVWSVSGDASWKDKFYLYEVEVYVRKEQAVKLNQVTDPYSVSLAMNSTRSQIADLKDRALAPSGWDTLQKPALEAPEDIVLYELHVRDFSIHDSTVPEAERGTFKAFTRDSNGTKHLSRLAKAGVTHVHLLPVFDIATIQENRASQSQPAGDLSAFAPDAEEQQAAIHAVRDADGFNWGYDPYHYTVPEGSYATQPDGSVRITEFREMVQSLNQRGLRVVMDVVYNHTNSSGQDPQSVLDRIVPGYYHRLNGVGNVETSTCCQNTATENVMMEKLMVDSLVTWAREYKVDGFRFDLMGHHMKANMLNVRAALDALTLEKDGVDGKAIYVYGEGWDFGEVQGNARGTNATQLNMPGTGIGTFSDRLRDAARGGGPFDDTRYQGFISGLFYDPNGFAQGTSEPKTLLLQHMDRIRVGLAGNLRDYSFTSVEDKAVKGSEVSYNGAPAGYTLDPQEVITYVSAHDNETLFDAVQLKAPRSASMDTRVRMHNMGISLVALAQGIPFFHAGDELLRSKSLDRNSYNSGDWFNRLDFTYQSNNWGVGLPPYDDNKDNWPFFKTLLADPALKPAPAHIAQALAHFEEVVRIRKSSRLFRLRTAAEIQQRVRFENTGSGQTPGLIVMSIQGDAPAAQGEFERAVVFFNATGTEQRFTAAAFQSQPLVLHPVQQESADPTVRTASFDGAAGTFVVPARSTVVFVQAPATPEPPPGEDDDGGCDCASANGTAFSALALLLGLSAMLRRRHAR
ncbi:pullulanase-type alpha-1,6-glucosidase [Stigmatella sp. ncwal1]|uniref:Pullulanase-type alpha-1,6-glucosidase n=1 Tax=Stigmatella ashevillensis TaxID=2995309 RepID=A0ABT5DA01_9BACT|nr:pullulanase-type alpha-1,6-glucosidase [Stigmatella ashevillena]MDC0710497.1 pullulanase-type alpha-1,6-glucosidase [Stigmatella ashevillena]